MNYASIGLRVLEGIIDLVICVAILWVIAQLFGQTTENGFQLTGVPFLIGIVVTLGYYIVLEGLWGATLGKLVLNLRVVKEADGLPIGWREALIRNVLRVVDGLFLYLVGFILICVSQKRQRLGDRIAGTIVIRSGG